MPRARTIRPNFPQTPAIGHLSREARLLFIQMWTLVDDSGRLRWDPVAVTEQLYPVDDDAPVLLAGWLAELERESLVEIYEVDGAPLLRVLQWRRLQTIQHPSRSRLPPAPHESHEAPHESHEDWPETQAGRASEADPHEGFFDDDATLLGGPRPITPERVTADLDRLQRKAESRGAHTAAARYTELMGRQVGLWGGRGAPTGRREPAEPLSPSPGQLLPRE